MPDDLRGFAKNNQAKKIDANDPRLKSAQDVYNKYKDYSEEGLEGEIKRLIIFQKQNGTFNKNALLANINTFASFIPQDKVLKLKELINKIDAEN